MIPTYLLKITHVSPQPADPVSTWHKTINRDWPSVPAADDYVAFGGPDDLTAPVTGVIFTDNVVILEFALHEVEGVTRDELERLGFVRQDRQEPPREWMS